MFLAASYVARRRVDSLCVSACSSSSRHGPGVERMWASQGLGLPMKLLLSRASGALLHGTRSLREGDTMNDHRRGAAGSGGSNIQSDYHRLFQRRVSGSWNNSRRAGPAHGRSEAYRGSEDVSELYGSGRGGIMGVAGGVAPVPMRIDLKKPDWSRKDREQQPIAKKDFYVECSSVSSKSQAEIDEWRAAHSIEVLGTGSCPRPMLSFDDTPFADSVKALLKSKFGGPSPIQSQGWSLALTGRDMVGSAQTGSGKTLAFILPALHHIASQPRSESSSRESTDLRTNPRAVFLVPTRELANQINDELLMFTPLYGYRTACVFGGSNNRLNQIRQIYQKPELLVATPGRLIDFVSSGTISLEDASYVVLDEADRMLDMGFEPQVRAILSQIHPDSQISMWSATWPKRIQRLASTFLKDSIRIRVGSDDLSANKSVKQEWVFCTRGQSLNRLQDLLKEHRGKKNADFL
ncbi:uncharacterized protein LOC126319896 [Schistocerca gregaria]|uniref:uncharacterized protein LOC126319896 n=1 Tax=Schistocerca gregaria TaxID=7010 RepID=UPI00211E6AE1|nr:uncharacterized protein LOC126319896 [Schistocerca gregaria]